MSGGTHPVLLPVFRGHILYPSSSTPSSEDASKVSSDEDAGYVTDSKRKEFNLNSRQRNLEGLSLGKLGVPQDGLGNDKRVRRVKLKFGGVTHTIQANAASNAASHRKQQEETLMGRIPRKNTYEEGDLPEPVRKSKRVPRRHVHDGDFNDDDYVDDEIWYLEKLKTPKVSAAYRDEEEFGKKHRKVSSV